MIQLGRQSNVLAAAEKCLPAKQSPKGLGQGQMVEAFVVLSALGGECLDDFTDLGLHLAGRCHGNLCDEARRFRPE
ncbi:MAG TPA: hypothetical protein VJM51_09535, partial [Dehalococcoidia bacterium]|nr:hypothetical protein [Dehalococcoidia bacterium]